MIDAGEIEPPDLMTFNQWQTWRSGPGRRPNKRVDGASSPQANESALWRATMAANHGDDWVTDLAVKEAGPEDAEDEEEEDPGGHSSPCCRPDLLGSFYTQGRPRHGLRARDQES